MTFGSESSSSAVVSSAAFEAALSPFSTPNNNKRRSSARRGSMASINRKEGYQMVEIPVGDEDEMVVSTSKRQNGGVLCIAAKGQITPTPKGNGGLSPGSGIVRAVKEKLFSNPTVKNSLGGEVSSVDKTTSVSKNSTVDKNSTSAANKNGGVAQDWEVIGASSTADLAQPVIDLDEYEDLALTATRSNTATIIDASDSEIDFDFEIIGSNSIIPPLPRRCSTIYPLRNAPIQHPLYSITATIILDLSLTPSTVVELSDGDFLKITDLIRNVDTNEVTLRGHRFQRTRDLNGLLAKKRNELCWVTEVDEDDERPASVQSLSEVPGSSVTRIRTALITNMAFPAATYRNVPHTGNRENVEHEGLVTVRWSYTTTWPSAKERINNENAFCERVLRHLGENDGLVGEGLRIRDVLAREKFRGPTILGGSYIPAARRGHERPKVVDLETPLSARGGKTNWFGRLAGSLGGGAMEANKECRVSGLFEGDMVDLTDELPKTNAKPRLSIAEALQERMLKQIDLTTPELSLPPIDGMVRATNAASKRPALKRVEGQMYTYGDACKFLSLIHI